MKVLWHAFDWSVVKTTVIVTAFVSIGAVMVLGFIWERYQSAQHGAQQALREQRHAERAIAQQTRQQREQEAYRALFEALPRTVLHGVPQHLDLLDQLRKISANHAIPALTLRMEPRQDVRDPRWNEAMVAFETIHLDMKLRHEVDLFRLIEALQAQYYHGALHWPQCLLQRTAATDTLVQATCLLAFYSVHSVTPVEGE